MNKEGGAVIYKDLSYNIVGSLFNVYNDLGFGYSEKTYELAIEKEFNQRKIKYRRQAPYNVIYKGEKISKNYIDFVVENKIVLELKKGDYFSRKNIEQIRRYIKVANLKLGILAHFTSKGVKTFRALNNY